MKRRHYAAFEGGVFVAEGRTPLTAFRAAGTALRRLYSPEMGTVQFEIVVHEATEAAVNAARSFSEAVASGQSDYRCLHMGFRADGILDVVEAPGQGRGFSVSLWPGGEVSFGALH